MPRKKAVQEQNTRHEPPALTPDERERQMIALAVNCAEKQLRDGTASSQIIVHYLRLATEREKLERDILERQRDLIEAKTGAYQSAQEIKELYEKAIDAMREYSGRIDSDDDEN